MTTTHTLSLTDYAENGGYDCMTGAYYVKNGEQTIATIDLHDFGQRTCGPINGDMLKAAESYGKLFAAAPDLLAALCMALPYVETELELHGEAYKTGTAARVLGQIRAAIAKAEGKQ